VIFDRGHFNPILWNLVRNAWQHCQKKEASVHIAARAGYMGDAVIFELADDGPGIPAELRGRIFEPMFTTKPAGEGTGLGLAIARSLVARHEGEIEVESRPGRTEFRVRLPLVGSRAS